MKNAFGTASRVQIGHDGNERRASLLVLQVILGLERSAGNQDRSALCRASSRAGRPFPWAEAAPRTDFANPGRPISAWSLPSQQRPRARVRTRFGWLPCLPPDQGKHPPGTELRRAAFSIRRFGIAEGCGSPKIILRRQCASCVSGSTSQEWRTFAASLLPAATRAR